MAQAGGPHRPDKVVVCHFKVDDKPESLKIMFEFQVNPRDIHICFIRKVQVLVYDIYSPQQNS